MRGSISLILATAFFGISSVASWANLEDTYDQCVARYGNPISHEYGDPTYKGACGWYLFKTDDYVINVSFSQGIDWWELFWKPDLTPLSPSEQDAILQANTESGKWVSQKIDRYRCWKRDDGAVAAYFPTIDAAKPRNFMGLNLATARRY